MSQCIARTSVQFLVGKEIEEAYITNAYSEALQPIKSIQNTKK